MSTTLGIERFNLRVALVAASAAFYALTFLPLHILRFGPVKKDGQVAAAALLSIDVSDGGR